jgi:murein hydrolase activator
MIFFHLILVFLFSTATAFAQEKFGQEKFGQEKAPQENSASKTELPKTELRLQEKVKREADLLNLESQIKQSDAQKQQTIKEVEQLRGDRAKLNKDLIDTTARVRSADERLNIVENKLIQLEKNASAIQLSLDSRKDVMVEVLASLQRMGRKPLPAVLVHPDDILAALRASILLGDVVPELRAEAELLAKDLEALSVNRKNQTLERENLKTEKEFASKDKERLASLISLRQTQIDNSEQKLKEERVKITSLAKEALTLKDLISRMESDIAGAAKAAEASKLVPLPGSGVKRKDAFTDPARLSPKIAFADLRGTLGLPVAGKIIKTYGSPDTYGGTEKGITIMPPSGAIISAPSDGWVAFSGSYRSYGQVLIVNTGNGYHLVFIGIDHTLVEIGQFVLAGEPIAVMSRKDEQSVKNDLPDKGTSLYIELRKDGQAIDSGPWWSQQQNEKARG